MRYFEWAPNFLNQRISRTRGLISAQNPFSELHQSRKQKKTTTERKPSKSTTRQHCFIPIDDDGI
jgi:hypothetical protein